MFFLARDIVTERIKDAIISRKVLKVCYQHVSTDNEIVERKKAPFDIGTTNPRTYDSNRDNVYLFCYNHIDDKTGQEKEFVHPININHIVSIEETGETFNENELADIHQQNTGYNYRECEFSLLPDRDWFKL
jgi:hypothetical protein